MFRSEWNAKWAALKVASRAAEAETEAALAELTEAIAEFLAAQKPDASRVSTKSTESASPPTLRIVR
jgi:hypothetical protein